MKANATYGFLLGVVLMGTAASVIHFQATPNPASKPEIVFEAPPILVCEDVGGAAFSAIRCTDKERDATCYVMRPGGSSPSVSCLPNQWLNYPESTANVNN